MTNMAAAGLAAALALTVSPLLASWTVELAAGTGSGWWRPRRPSTRRWAVVAAATVLLAAAAVAGRPQPAWWLLAAGGEVLAVVDAERHLLPARFTYPLGAVVLLALIAEAVVGHNLAALTRAVAAAAAVAGVWFAAAFASPRVRLAAVTAAALGWVGWQQVLLGQALTALFAAVTAAIIAIAQPRLRGRRMPLPMGPAMITAAILACWL